MCSLLLKELINFNLTSLQLVLCHVAAVNVSPFIIHIADYILFLCFVIRGYILINQKGLIGLDSYSTSSMFTHLDSFCY